MTTQNVFIIECMRPNCRFRFHASTSQGGQNCPKCGGPISERVYEIPETPHRQTAATDLPVIEVLMDNIRSAYNVGSILRTSDAAGVAHLHVSGVSPTPDQEKVRKTALGAEFTIPWTQHWNALDAIRAARSRGLQIVSLEINPSAVSLFELPSSALRFPILFVLGNEVTGVDPAIQSLSDLTVEIPMYGIKRSINVSNAFSIAVYFLRSKSLDKNK